MEKEEFIKELLDYIKDNTTLQPNGSYIVDVKWLRKFIEEHK